MNRAARNVVAAKKANGGSNCLSPQVLIVSKEWPQREAFLSLVEEELKRQRDELAYYPGARERRDAALVKCGMKPLGSESDAVGFVRDVCDEVLEEEVFGPFLAVKEVDGGLLEAADFANQKCRGTLSCTVLHPQSLNTMMLVAVVDKLDYGSVAVNVWSAFGYTAPRAARPGARITATTRRGPASSGTTTASQTSRRASCAAGRCARPWTCLPFHLASSSTRRSP